MNNDKYKAEINGIKSGMIVKVASGHAYKTTGNWFCYPGMEPVISGLPLNKKMEVRNPDRPCRRNLTIAMIVEVL